MSPRADRLVALALVATLLLPASPAGAARMMNPATDVLWDEIFPIKIGSMTVYGSDNYDSTSGSAPVICTCPMPPPVYYRVGLGTAFWEPSHVIEVVKSPNYMPMTGSSINGPEATYGTSQASTINPGHGGGGSEHAFAHAHLWSFPVWLIMGMMIDSMCMSSDGELDMMYMTEFDPLWSEDELAAMIHPESVLFANPLAVIVCLLDSLSTQLYGPADILYWCMGAQGTAYPLTGNINNMQEVDAAAGVAQRLIFKLNREMIMCDPGIWYCACQYPLTWVKSNYKFHSARPVKEWNAWPIGKSSLFRTPINPPGSSVDGPCDEFLWVLLRHRLCCAE